MPSVSNAENGTTWTPNSQVHVVIFENRWLSVDDMKSHASKIGHQPNSDVIRKFPTPSQASRAYCFRLIIRFAALATF